MTGKERILAAIAMEPTDRQPRDFHGCGEVVERLHQHYGTATYRQLLDKLHSDVVDIRGIVDPEWIGPFPKVQTLPDGSTRDYLGFRKKPMSTVFGIVEEHCDYILKDCEDIEEMQALYSFPQVEWFDFSGMSEKLKEYEDLAIMASGASVFQHPTLIRQMDMFLCDLAVEPELAEYLMEGYTNFYCDYYDAMFRACPGQIDILRIADDMGMQDRPLISRDMVETYIIPRVKRLCDMAHSHGVKVLFHSCGSIFSFIDLLIEAGVDILDPLQPLAKDMAPEHIAQRYLGKICLHGSIDTQYLLTRGTPQLVAETVQKHCHLLGSLNTGFIIAPAHTLQPDMTTENIVAMYAQLDRAAGLT